MANEISSTARLKIAAIGVDLNPGRIQVDQTNQNKVSVTKSFGTSESTISLSNLTTPACFFFQNLDATNYIEVGLSTGVYSWKLIANDIPAQGRLPAGVTTLYVKANTAACRAVIEVFDA
jgi:hypothetical protein